MYNTFIKENLVSIFEEIIRKYIIGIGRRKDPILGYVPKKKKSDGKGLNEP